ncbi:MAG: Ig-like domain-containing protein [Acetivibrionales bacterium]
MIGKGFERVVIDEYADESQTITVKADIGTMTINAKIKINVKTGEIENIIIDKSAQDASISLADEVKVLLITVDAKVSFTGNGTIVSVTINADEVSFEQKPEKMTVKEGIKDPDINSPSIGGGGGGSSNPPSPEKLTLLNVSPTADAENAHLKWDYLNFVFNKDMAEIQTKEGIVLKDENNNIIPIKNVVPGTTEKTSLLIIVDTELQLNTKYSIIVPENTIVSATGEKYDKEISYSFKTAKNVISGTLNTKNSYQDYNVYLTKGSDVIDTTKVVNYKQFFFTNISESGIYDIVVRDLENTIIFRETVEIDNSSVNEIIVSPILTEIEITKMPTKTVYNIGDTIDITGMIVIGTYSDGSTKIENITTDMITGFDSTKAADSQIITVTVNGKNTTYTIVINVPVTSVTVNPSRLELVENEVVEIEAVISPLNATNKSVTWSSSSTTVAAISIDGIVTAKTSGSAIITVITADGNKTATCEVTVKSFDDATEDEKAKAIASLYFYSSEIEDRDGMDRAIEMGNQILEISPNNVIVNLIIGLDLSNKEQYEEALACLEIVIENDVENTEYKASALLLGAVINHYHLGDTDKAINYLDEFIKMDHSEYIFDEIGDIIAKIIEELYWYSYNNDDGVGMDKAIGMGEEMLEAFPENVIIKFMLGCDLSRKGFYTESLNYFESIIENYIDSDYYEGYKADALFEAAEAYYYLDNVEKAISYLIEVVNIDATEESVNAAIEFLEQIPVNLGVLSHIVASNFDFTPINDKTVKGIDDYIYRDDIIEFSASRNTWYLRRRNF